MRIKEVISNVIGMLVLLGAIWLYTAVFILLFGNE